jgi:hypothetical protein
MQGFAQGFKSEARGGEQQQVVAEAISPSKYFYQVRNSR